MMGEYIPYYKGKIFGGICEYCFLVKPIKSALAMMPNVNKELSYEGAKEMIHIDNVDDQEFLQDLIQVMIPELLVVKKKKMANSR